jgi:hypothetical protein
MAEANAYYTLADEFAKITARSVFLTGKAGTGKTTFLRRLKEETQKQIAVVAPTGVAAINAGGVTMHSFFQLPFTPFVPTAEGRRNLISKIKMSTSRRKLMQELEMLVIDEISMVRADVLDEVDAVLRYFRYNQAEPFGGLQVFFIGDMYQLPPVVQGDEWNILSQFYQTPYFFHSKVIQQCSPLYIEFDKIFRQQNEHFIYLLNEIRSNMLSYESMKLLGSRYQPDFKLPKKNNYIVLTTHNAKADRINAEEMTKIKSKTYRFEAIIKGEFPERNYPNEAVLELKEHAKVMFISNDKHFPRRYFNGKIGEVSRIEKDKIFVHCENDKDEIEVCYETWTNIRYTINKQNNQIEENELGSYTQYPLRLAWAITIHKSQGLTFDKAVIDAEAAFTSGQVYVALSRCRTLEGLVLLSPIHKDCLHVDPHIVQYAKSKPPLEILNKQLENDKKVYNQKILLSIFDFKRSLVDVTSIQELIRRNSTSFNSQASSFIDELTTAIKDMDSIGERFKHQLLSICQQENMDQKYLQNRIAAASDYFLVQIDKMLSSIRQSPVETDSRENAYTFTESLRIIYQELARKKYIMEGIKEDYSTAKFFERKKTFKNPVFNVNAYSLYSKDKGEHSLHPALYRLLKQLRYELSEIYDSNTYQRILSTKALEDISNYLPLTMKDLKRIRGFGKQKIKLFGQEFLDLVVDYCRKNELESRMNEMPTVKK